MNALRIGSLFSGIGGLELGLVAARVGHVVWQCEPDQFCRRILKRWHPGLRLFTRVENLHRFNVPQADLICGGFPCQDVSSAGARRGLAGSRSGLWHQFARIVDEIEPGWVVVENVTSGAKLWVDAVVCELGQLGYEALPVPVQADWLGAPYPRARVFVVARRLGWRLADAYGDLQPLLAQHAEVARAPAASCVGADARQAADAHDIELRQQPGRSSWTHREVTPVAALNRWREPMPNVDGVVPGATRRMAQRAAGNCVVPAQAQVVGELINILRQEHAA